MNVQAILDGVDASGLNKPSFFQTLQPYSPTFLSLEYHVSGFNIVLRVPDGLKPCRARFPWLDEYLTDVIHPLTTVAYLGPVLAGPGSKMLPHRDGSLNRYLDNHRYPYTVTVLYLEVSKNLVGGRLILEGRPITPYPGLMVTFPGHLTHEVEEVWRGRRVSFVAEQFRLPPEETYRVPVFEVP